MPTADFEAFADRPFSFYPPIVNIEHNEWRFQKGNWSEVLVSNTRIELDLWIPRRFLGEVSRVEAPVMIVGLDQELEYKGGRVWPHNRRVLAMPSAGAGRAEEDTEPPPEAPRGSRDSATEKKISRLIVSALVIAVVLMAGAVLLFREKESGGRIDYKTILQANLGLTAEDTYFSVIRKLGEPSSDRWRSESGESQFRALEYPNLKVTVILMGADREQIYYIGAKDQDWNNVHSVALPSGGSTDSMLRSLPRF